MKVYKNIHLLGTSHIAEESVRQVRETIESVDPHIIAVELDAGRAYSLKAKEKRPKDISLLRSLGVKGYLFYTIGEFMQKRLGKIVNMDPGSDMLSALEAAEQRKTMVAFIDRDIRVTLSRLRYFKKREIAKMVFDIITGGFNKTMSIDLSKTPSNDVIDMVVSHTKKRYPSLFKVLIDERDIYMARKLNHISSAYPDKKIIAIVGAGHVRGILNYLEKA